MATLAGFQAWIVAVMGLSQTAINNAAPVIPIAYNVALSTVNPMLNNVPNQSGIDDYSIYSLAVYNLGGDRLVAYAQDVPPDTTFAGLRASFGLTGGFVPGVVQSSSDEATSETLDVLDSLKGLTIGQLANLKTPWGRQYLAFAQSVGSNVGVS